MTALTVTPGTEEWLEERKKYIGASDAPAICGLTPSWRSPRDVALEKLGKTDECKKDNKYLQRGTLLEPLVKHFYLEKTGHELFSAPMYRHNEYEWMAATPDAWAVSEGLEVLLECKTAVKFTRDEWREIDSSGRDIDSVPQKYWVQVQHQLAVTAEERAFVAVIFASEDLFTMLVKMVKKGIDVAELYKIAEAAVEFCIIEVKRDEVFIAGLIEKERQFWDDLQRGLIPDNLAVIQDSGGVRVATSKEELLLGKFKEAYLQKVLSEQNYEESSAIVKEAIGEDSGLYSEALGKVLYKKGRSRRRVEWKRLAEDLLNRFISPVERNKIKKVYSKYEEAGRRFTFPHKLWLLR